MNIQIPALSVVLLVGPSGSGKSTFAKAHFKPSEVLSSDYLRGVVCDDESNQAASKDAFEVLRYVAQKRLARGLLTVVDATNVQPESRQTFLALARENDVFAAAIVLDLPEKVCQARNEGRPDRDLSPHVIRNQRRDLHRSMRRMRDEGFRYVYTLRSEEEVATATVERVPLWTDRRADTGPFDIIGDVHGCASELETLLSDLGYSVVRDDSTFGYTIRPPSGRRAIFLGDLVDRGPRIPDVLRIVMHMVGAGTALCIPGNHEVKLLRKLRGKEVKMTHGLRETVDQLAAEPPEFSQRVADFIDRLVSHYVLDAGRLVVAHAGLKEAYQGRASGRVREFALFGDTTGETDDLGLPVRLDWAEEYRGQAMVVYGHTPVSEATWHNRTICVDTGCVFGGSLTALRYPERELVSVEAAEVYYAPARPLAPARAVVADTQRGDLLDINDVMGVGGVETRLGGRVKVRPENATPALEVMSRFAVDPRWLIYLPPTMSPPETAKEGDYLERPAEAFAYFRKEGVERVICEEKHMGSRSVMVVCRDKEAARARFGAADALGVIYTRTGRPFFSDPKVEQTILERLSAAVGESGLWDELSSPWLCLDCELMPWSAKAMELLRSQYAPAGVGGRVGLAAARAALAQAHENGLELGDLPSRFAERARQVSLYVDAYRRYCWPVVTVDDYKIAPFHVMAGEGAVYTDKNHGFHMDVLARLARADEGLFRSTRHLTVALNDDASVQAGVSFWEELTDNGGEGMVVKPYDFVARGRKGLVQPAVKVRGREYLRIIYGPEYTAPENLERLRARAVSAKRSLALREFALGLEGLERFVANEPLYRVHACAFAVLALETEPVDPRL